MADLEELTELRAVAMREDLERLGRYDDRRVRQRLRDGFNPEHTLVIEVNGELAGCVALRPAEDCHWLEHFFLAPHAQGCGIGSAVLSRLLESCDRDGNGNGNGDGDGDGGGGDGGGRGGGGGGDRGGGGGGRPVRLNVLQGSPARRLYERHGFVLESEDPVDVFMVRPSPEKA